LAKSLDVVALCACAEMLGGMQWILETSAEYAKTRQQFGKTIGSFQAVQAMLADMVLWTESVRSAVYYAAWALDADPADARRAVGIAKAYTSDASREVANRGVQVHGGIGFTWEHDMQLFYKRSKALEILTGDSAHHRAALAELVFDNA
jgi:alkylation response protein AidB-like acyl-CoA dehydrogenase